MNKIGKIAATALVASVIAGPAIATTVTFDSFATTTDNPVIDTAPTVTVNDDTLGFLTFTVTTANANGELSGIFLDFGGFSGIEDDFTSLTPGVSITDITANTNDLGNGRNLNGNFGGPINGPSGAFDIAIGFDDGENGGAGRQISVPFSFTLTDFLGSLTLADLTRVGLRFQSVGTLGSDGLGDGSEKLIAAATTTVPLPAAGWFLLSGLVGIGAMRRRQR